MNQAELKFLVSGLRLKVGPPRKIKNLRGQRGTLEILRKHVTDLVVQERVEYRTENVGILTRQYTERLISDAIAYGDRHEHTMEMADWWLQDKSAVHKLFKVLAPRFKDFTTSYTRMFYTPLDQERSFYGITSHKVVVELKGNPFPRLEYPNQKPNKRHIHNVLLSEAKKEFRIDLASQSSNEKQSE